MKVAPTAGSDRAGRLHVLNCNKHTESGEETPLMQLTASHSSFPPLQLHSSEGSPCSIWLLFFIIYGMMQTHLMQGLFFTSPQHLGGCQKQKQPETSSPSDFTPFSYTLGRRRHSPSLAEAHAMLFLVPFRGCILKLCDCRSTSTG